MRTISLAVVAVTLSGCGIESRATPSGPPSAPLLQNAAGAQYGVTRLTSSLGGTISRGNSINNKDWVAGYSNLPGNATRHAVLWRNGGLVDLQTLGGPNSMVAWPGQNNTGMVVGIAETAALDPYNESWSCSAFFPTVTHHVCYGFAWESGVMTPMPTFGGTNSFATGVNAQGQVVGWAETAVHDPTCNAPQVLQFRAALWDPKTGAFTQLAPLYGDSTSAATAVNDSGQVVGISGACDVAVGNMSAAHAVLWDHGTATNIGSLGGALFNTPMAINSRGDVTGLSDLPGDVITHAFLWTRNGGIRDLGTLPGDTFSQANGINTRGQVVGTSCGAFCRAFLWENGVMTDLNTLVGPGFPDLLNSAQDINEAGDITGRVRDAATGKQYAFVAKHR